MTSTPQQLHDAIMNIPARDLCINTAEGEAAYRRGHRDARHAAAELVAGATPDAASPEELVKPLKAVLDRTWGDETPEQVVAIAANGLHWRDYTIEILKAKAASLRTQIEQLLYDHEDTRGKECFNEAIRKVLALLDATETTP